MSIATQGRPHFGRRQVRTSAGVVPGNDLVMVRGDEQYRDVIIVLSEPYVSKRGKLVFDFVHKEHLSRDAILGRIYHLNDFGIVPYKSDEGDVWNPTNHLLRTGRRRLTPEEVKTMKAKVGSWV